VRVATRAGLHTFDNQGLFAGARARCGAYAVAGYGLG
jgi:hypothetical protein